MGRGRERAEMDSAPIPTNYNKDVITILKYKKKGAV